MRIDRVLIKDFKNLQDFEADFDEQQARTVIIGRNGVGKTNLLVALTQIFRDLDLRERPQFGFTIHYRCNGHCVEVIASSSQQDMPRRYKLQFRIGVGEDRSVSKMESYTEAEFYKFNSHTRVLPNNIFGYYSGTSDRLRELFRKHEEIHRDNLIRHGDKQSIRYLFLAKPEHSQYVLLAFFALADKKVKAFLQKHFDIVGLDSAMFVLREPYWSKTQISEERKKAGDPRFWYAGGKVRSLLEILYAKSLAPMRRMQQIRIGLKRTRKLEHVYCFLPNEESAAALADGIDQKELFRRLESLQTSDLLGKLWIWCNLRHSRIPLSFDDLSEGEQQLLTVLGLLRFTNEDESLFLLDEPDTHLNPAWCLDYLNILHDYGSDLRSSQMIMTTHNPIVFAGLSKSEVLVMRRSGDGRVSSEHPSSDPKGKGFSAILTGDDLFGLRSTLDADTLKEMEEKRVLSKVPNRTLEQEERLQILNTKLHDIELANSAIDPLFREFAEAMDAELPERLQQPVLTSEERDERRNVANTILKRIRSKS